LGRIRHNLIYGEYGLDIFISGDQLLRGAALNAFEIMQLIAQYPSSKAFSPKPAECGSAA
jgi:aspartate-semialdehyde dehydrogenase